MMGTQLDILAELNRKCTEARAPVDAVSAKYEGGGSYMEAAQMTCLTLQACATAIVESLFALAPTAGRG
jgi:hypothetical protein